MLKSRLFQAEMQKRREQQQSEEEQGEHRLGQPNPLVCADQSRIKDLRTAWKAATRRRCWTAHWVRY